MLIEEHLLLRWMDNFYGYGSWQARCWFIGHEEGGGEFPEAVADKLNYFDKVDAQAGGTLCDIRELYKNVAVRREGEKAGSFDNQYEYRFGANAVLHGVWKNLIGFVHGYRHEDIEHLLAYQQHDFLSPQAGSEALIQLYPLPGPHSHAWYYSWLELPALGFLKSRGLYQEHLYDPRIHTILSNIRTYRPEIIMMFGMENINTLKRSVQAFFPGAVFRMSTATKRQIPQHHRTDLEGTTLLITSQVPALKHNRIETAFDWKEFGRRVKSGDL